MSRSTLRWLAVGLAAAVAFPAAGVAVPPGEKVEDAELPALTGGRAQHVLPGGASIHVLVFVKTGHPHCLEALQSFAARDGQPAGAHWVAILPGDTSPADARALASAAGVKMPFLLDTGDRLYGKLGIDLHPTIVIVDKQGTVAAVEPYRRIQYVDRVVARIRFTLGEITEAQLAEEEDPGRSETTSDEAGVARHHEKFAAQLLAMGQLPQALAEVNKGLAIIPSATGYALQGKVLTRMGRCGEAAQALELALRLEPGNRDAAAEKSHCVPGGRTP